MRPWQQLFFTHITPWGRTILGYGAVLHHANNEAPGPSSGLAVPSGIRLLRGPSRLAQRSPGRLEGRKGVGSLYEYAMTLGHPHAGVNNIGELSICDWGPVVACDGLDRRPFAASLDGDARRAHWHSGMRQEEPFR